MTERVDIHFPSHPPPIRPPDHSHGHRLGLYTGVAVSLLGDLAMGCSKDLAVGTSLSLSLSLPTCGD
jgi:hypothetical protein